MKKLIILCSLLVNLSLMAQEPANLVKLDCSDFRVSASKDMSEANTPHNWKSAIGMPWTSENVFAQNVSEGNMSFIGKAIRFGNSTGGAGSVTSPSLNLKTEKDEKAVLRVMITSGADKTGELQIWVDDRLAGKIEAQTGNKGKPFGRGYYAYEFIVDGTPSSIIKLIHKSSSGKGLMYVNDLSVARLKK